jgi:two-component system, NarL family, response regulator NreC
MIYNEKSKYNCPEFHGSFVHGIKVRFGFLNLQRNQPIEFKGLLRCGTVEQARLKKPTILLADIGMPGTSGIELIHEVKRRSPKTSLLILTMHVEPAFLDSALAAGACGYVLKRALDSDLLTAIRIALGNGTFIDLDMTPHLLGKHRHPQSPSVITARQARDLLSRRELQILTLIAKGHTHRGIGWQTNISVKSVETYRAHLLQKLNLTTRRDIVQFALHAGLLVSSPSLAVGK